MYGENFWFDEQDWDEHNRKQTALRNSEKEKSMRTEQLSPILTLLTTAAGRSLKARELRLLENMDEKEIAVFAKLMQDVVSVEQINEPQFGYGYFND
ncbi:hypothetical protein [Paenibacillus qinlingensis]|uniref:hypothetical protein n=1 Tax=Paenibacillus qinlingensis TaxID=1837343 RepID=UPI001FE8BB51|nr:hypothetical protein [Paenibacillus qinlingensis]